MSDNDTIPRLLTMLRLIPRYPERIETATLEHRFSDEGFHVMRRPI